MNKLSEHINEEILKFNDIFSSPFWCENQETIKMADRIERQFKQSLKSIAYKSIDAVRVKTENEEYAEHDLEIAVTPNVIKLLARQVGKNQTIQKSAQKEKQFKGQDN